MAIHQVLRLLWARSGKRQTKTYEEIMILGSPHVRVVAVKGKPLMPDQDEEQRKLDGITFQLQHESPEQREREREREDTPSAGSRPPTSTRKNISRATHLGEYKN